MAVKSSLKRNVFYSVCYQVLLFLLPLITSPYVSRVLGVRGIGIYSHTQVSANYFYLFAMLGVNKYGVREIARVRDDRERLRETFWSIYLFQAGTALFVVLMYVLYAVTAVTEHQLFCLLQTFYVLSGAVDVSWACFGLEQFRYTTIRSTIVRLLSVICIFLFVREVNDLWQYTLILSASFLVTAFSIWPYILRKIPFKRPLLSEISRHIGPNLLLFWPVLAVSIYNLMDKLMLGFYSSDEVGYYANAERIIRIPTALLLALENGIMPRMANLYAKKGSSEGTDLLGRVMWIAMCLGSAMTFGVAAVGKRFAPWFYGDEFVRCGLFIVYLSPVILFKSWAGALRTQYIIPAGKDRLYLISLTSGAVINLVLNIILIPKMLGTGAIIGTLAAEGTVALLQFVMLRKELPILKYVKDGLIFVLIGLIMYAVIAPISKMITNSFLCLAVQTAAGILIFGVGTLIYAIVSKRIQPYE